MTVQEKAAEFSKFFTRKQRPNGDVIVVLKDESPGELHNLVYEVHSNYTPDNWTYRFIEDALDRIAGSDDIAEVEYEIESDIYTSDLTAWLHSRNDRVHYLTEAGELLDKSDGFVLLSEAQLLERREVFNLVVGELEKLDEDDLEETEDEEC